MATHTATHNGTCQACGRVQAVGPKTGLLAKHGYTVDWGFFNGTCPGSDHKPLQHDWELNEQIVQQLRKDAERIAADAEKAIRKVSVQVGSNLVYGKRVPEYKAFDREEYEAHFAGKYCTGFDREVEFLRERLRRQAKQFRDHASDLEELRHKTFGKPLIERRTAADLRRETFPSYKAACARIAELKAQGIEARSRRASNWGSSYTVTYR